jgi:hypothetical protein
MTRNLVLLSLLLSAFTCFLAYKNNELSIELDASEANFIEYRDASISMFKRQEDINNKLIGLAELIKQHVIVLEKKHLDPSEITYLRVPEYEKANTQHKQKEIIEI